jgi:energy-coupling factor transport system permease protein
MISAAPVPPPSVIHRLHPLTKISTALLLTLASLFCNEPLALALLVSFLVAVLLISRVRPSLGSWLGVLLLLGLVAAGNYWASGTPAEAARYSLRFAVLVLGIPVSALTTSPPDLARALAQWRLPAPLVISFLLVWRFFPALQKELREIREANRLRGAASSGWPSQWYRSVLVPLAFFIMAYADRVALALELRAFTPAAPRTWYRPPQVGYRDGLFLGLAGLCLLLAGLLEF